mmetsp:Transcript_34049/g.87300  ORF Transcript_34049/g.87300 Transcript_34049/m.87300 type:complete len:204 (+) Transcript_34049:277-888(+)
MEALLLKHRVVAAKDTVHLACFQSLAQLLALGRRQQPLQRRVQMDRGHHQDASASRAVAELEHHGAPLADLQVLQHALREPRLVAPLVACCPRPQVREALVHEPVVREPLVLGEQRPLDVVVLKGVLPLEPLLDLAAVVREARRLAVTQLQHAHALLGGQLRVVLAVADAPVHDRHDRWRAAALGGLRLGSSLGLVQLRQAPC